MPPAPSPHFANRSDGWRNVVLKGSESGWTNDVPSPSGNTPDLGYVEFAGWVPRTQLLVAREVRQDGRLRCSFETVRLDLLLTDKEGRGTVVAEHVLPLAGIHPEKATRGGLVLTLAAGIARRIVAMLMQSIPPIY